MKIKSIIINIFIAVIAALVAVIAYAKIAGPVTEVITYREDRPTWFTNLPDDFEADKFDFTYAAEKTVHGVVHVKVTSMRRQPQFQQRRQDPLHEWFFGPRQEREPEPVTGFGSGVIISEDGYIVTNYHVIENATAVEVVLNDRRSYEASIVGSDPNSDIALLKVEAEGLRYIEFGDSDDLRLGQWVLAVGNPMNLTSTVTAGIVSARGRTVGIFSNRDMPIESFIQTDAAVNRGNSGGALVNLRGELVGIPTLIMSPTGAFAGNSFAVPVSIVKKVVDDIIEFGEVQRAVLGIRMQELSSDLAREKGIDRLEGVYVDSILVNSAAEEAGLKEGDVILRIDNVTVNSPSELQEQVARYRPNDKINILVNRNNRTQQITATLRNLEGHTEIVRPQEAYLGARFREVPRDIRRELNIRGGVQITDLGPGKFMEAGMRETFIITSINNRPVNSPADIREILDGHTGGVLVEGVYPDGTVAYYALGL
ncbi:MAG: Do family serine endopeptidase [Marinilabiliales bacterium]|nr:MAG: Do family serine endopeptidase [Marinilabiliales bacterium]